MNAHYVNLSGAVLLLLCIWDAIVEAAPFFGLGITDALVAASNATSLLSSLASAHAQHTIDKFSQLGELAQLGLNFTEALFTGR